MFGKSKMERKEAKNKGVFFNAFWFFFLLLNAVFYTVLMVLMKQANL